MSSVKFNQKCASFQFFIGKDQSIFDEKLNTNKQNTLITHKHHEDPILVQDLLNYYDSYPSVTNSYGGSLPLSRLSNIDIVNVQSSIRWKNKHYTIPKANPSFNKLWNDHPDIFD